MMVGGKLIEAELMHLDNGTFVCRLWVIDPGNADEKCVDSEPFSVHQGPSLGEEIWWQSGKIYFDGDKRSLRKIGFSFTPQSSTDSVAPRTR
jgi:hypothetical protein